MDGGRSRISASGTVALGGNRGADGTRGSAAPTRLLRAAAISVIAAAALLSADPVAAHLAGYLLASVVTISLLITYLRVDAARRNRPGYRAARRSARYGSALVVLGVLVAAGHAWALATRWAG
jgi:hypothetical protein